MPVRLLSQEEPIPGYRLIERLGRGGFGEVWKAEAPGGFLKAIKFVFGDLDSADDTARPAEQEKKALERVKLIRHPYILSLEQVQVVDGQLIIVMELADRNLWDRFRECRAQGLPGIPRDELLRYMEETAEALDLMNNHYNIQHLDIKPQNLFLVYNHIKVADFGLAKMFEGGRGTITGGVTPVYAAPETFEGWISRYTDQYSLAIVFQELLTGTRPFNGSNTRQLLMQHLNGQPDLSHLPECDRAIIARALAKKPDDRWPSCMEMVRALKHNSQASTKVDGPAFSRPSLENASGGHSSGLTVESVGISSRPPTQPATTRQSISQPSSDPSPSRNTNPSPPRNQPVALTMPRRADFPHNPSTPLPALVTVSPHGLVTPQPAASPAVNPVVTQLRGQIFQTGRMHTLGTAPPERLGDGVLFPAIVITLGYSGQLVHDHLKRIIHERFPQENSLSHIRFLHIETDPNPCCAEEKEVAGFNGVPVQDWIVARLNRPGHYLQHPHLPPVENWMPAGSLYKLPRNPTGTEGIRALGRLALLDNFRSVAQRIRQEIETFLTDSSLESAVRATGLGLRSNRPRVYIVAHLGGGTAGMATDLAYLMRHELRSFGYLRPEVVGLFLLPRVDDKNSRSTALANAYAALTELYHFQNKCSQYQVVYDKSEPPVIDAEPPFARIGVLEESPSPPATRLNTVTSLAARSLFIDLLTPAGRVIDELRDVYRKAFPSSVPSCHTYGLFRLSWPRAELLVCMTQRFVHRMLSHWISKDATHLQESIRLWLEQQWQDRHLAFEELAATLLSASRTAMQDDPERVFEVFLEPLRTRTPSSARLDATAVCHVLDQLLRLVGKPEPETEDEKGSVWESLSRRYEEVIREVERDVAFLAVQFIEQPQFRFAGAEEAVRQISERLKKQLEILEPMRLDLEAEVRSIYSQILQHIAALTNHSVLKGLMARKTTLYNEILDLLRNYPRKKLQLHVLELALSVYRKLDSGIPEIIREINLCRSTLNDLAAAVAPHLPPQPFAGPGKIILPEGCTTLEQAADQFLATLSPDDLLSFEQTLQKDIQKLFRGLVTVCIKANAKAEEFREHLLNRARGFLDSRLEKADPATVLLNDESNTKKASSLLAEAYDESAPELSVRGMKNTLHEFFVAALPDGPNSEKLTQMLTQTLPGVEFTSAQLTEDIVFYREYPLLELTALPQMGEPAYEAYQRQLNTDHPVHSRRDIHWNVVEPADKR